MNSHEYLMEHEDEWFRLELKTDSEAIERQALWAGIRPGMQIADIGCGSGKTTHILNQLVQPEGSIVGVDFSIQRITHAKNNYSGRGISFLCRDITEPLDDLGKFDFVWVRFILEYFRKESFSITKNLSRILNPGGILCLIDLDYNCLTHFGLTQRFEKAFLNISNELMKNANFDPYVGRKLYSFIYDLGFENIEVNLTPHHLIYGALKETDAFNWSKKIEIAAKKSGYGFPEFEGGYEEFYEEFQRSFRNPRRLSYTPLISCKGSKPFE